jgi:transposase
VCDSNGYPLAVHLTPGQEHESQSIKELIGSIELADHDGNIMPFADKLAGDKGYRADWIDDYLIALGIQPVIPSKANEDRSQRQTPFDREAYRKRNMVERLIGWLKECRRIFSRFEKTAKNFLGMIRMSFIQRYLKTMTL